MKVKILYDVFTQNLEDKVNKFIKDKKIINISFSDNDNGFLAYIQYEE